MWSGDPDVTGKLEEASNEWIYTLSSGTKERYTKNGQLVEISYRNGANQLVEYDTSSKNPRSKNVVLISPYKGV